MWVEGLSERGRVHNLTRGRVERRPRIDDRPDETTMRSIIFAVLTLVASASALQAATSWAPLRPTLPSSAVTRLRCAEGSTGKGFGSAKAPAAPKKKKKNAIAAAARAAAQQAGSAPPSAAVSLDPDDPTKLTAEERGRRALEAMRKSSGTSSSLKVGKKKLQLTPEEMEPEADSTMPQVVADRMLARILPFAALPVVGGVLLFIAFWYANTQAELDVPPTIVAYATQAMLLLSFGGITYGVMSTNLEEEEEQSALGASNFKRNLDIMRGVEDERIAGERTACVRVSFFQPPQLACTAGLYSWPVQLACTAGFYSGGRGLGG